MCSLWGYNCLYRENRILSSIGQRLNPIYFISETPILRLPKGLWTLLHGWKNEEMAMKHRMWPFALRAVGANLGPLGGTRGKATGFFPLHCAALPLSFQPTSCQLHGKFPLNRVSVCEMIQKCSGNAHSRPLFGSPPLTFTSQSFLSPIL